MKCGCDCHIEHFVVYLDLQGRSHLRVCPHCVWELALYTNYGSQLGWLAWKTCTPTAKWQIQLLQAAVKCLYCLVRHSLIQPHFTCLGQKLVLYWGCWTAWYLLRPTLSLFDGFVQKVIMYWGCGRTAPPFWLLWPLPSLFDSFDQKLSSNWGCGENKATTPPHPAHRPLFSSCCVLRLFRPSATSRLSVQATSWLLWTFRAWRTCTLTPRSTLLRARSTVMAIWGPREWHSFSTPTSATKFAKACNSLPLTWRLRSSPCCEILSSSRSVSGRGSV